MPKCDNLIITCLIFLFLLCQAYYRRASANMALGKFKLSLKDYEVVGTIVFQEDDKSSELLYLAKILACNFRTLFISFWINFRHFAET